MNEEKRTEIQKWLIKAQHDLGSARRLMEGDEPYLDTAVYHCQQAVEKALKAFLTYHDVSFEKTHDSWPGLRPGFLPLVCLRPRRARRGRTRCPCFHSSSSRSSCSMRSHN